MKIKYCLYLIFISSLIISCQSDILDDIPENIAQNESLVAKVALSQGNGFDDPFIERQYAESYETVILPELESHLFLGAILRKSSISSTDYKPLVYDNRTPIKFSALLPGAKPVIMEAPTPVDYYFLMNETIEKASFKQNSGLTFTIEQFDSYNELNKAFGTNVNAGSIFWGSHTETSGEIHEISKATGVAVRFYQESFKVRMNPPAKGFPEVPQKDVNDAVYVNNITYGRLAILTMETNYSYRLAKEKMDKVFQKLFVKGSSTMTKEEKELLDGAEFKVYIIAGDGKTAAAIPFSGYEGFVKHIINGSFSKDSPGVPIFCTFNHVKDNSPVKVPFEYSIRKKPLYVEMKKKDGNLHLFFYKNRNRVPVIAHPKIKFKLKKKSYKSILKFREVHLYETISNVQNAAYQTSTVAYPDPKFYSGITGHRLNQKWIDYSYHLEPGQGYEILGTSDWDIATWNGRGFTDFVIPQKWKLVIKN